MPRPYADLLEDGIHELRIRKYVGHNAAVAIFSSRYDEETIEQAFDEDS